MARYKPIDTSPRFLVVDLQRQLLPGTSEHVLNHLIDYELDLSRFDARFNNDASGATAYPPAMLLKVILFTAQIAQYLAGNDTLAPRRQKQKIQGKKWMHSQTQVSGFWFSAR